jgi:hypothetical protein
MPKIVIIGSCRFAPYRVLIAPNPWNKEVKELLKNNHEEAARLAEKKFHPAIDKTDEVWIYSPDGIGIHTMRDLNYAIKQGKKVRVLVDYRNQGYLTNLFFYDFYKRLANQPETSHWRNNDQCHMCGAKADPNIKSCETGYNYCSDDHAKQHVKKFEPEDEY